MKLDHYLEKVEEAREEDSVEDIEDDSNDKTADNSGVVNNLEEKDIVSTLEEAEDLIDKCNGALTQDKIDDAKEFIILIADKIEEAKTDFIAAVND